MSAPLALPRSSHQLRTRLTLLVATCVVALLLPSSTLAQGATPLAGEAPREVEVDVKDGTVELPRGEEAPLVPPVLEADSPATWPEGYAGADAEVTLELRVDEQGQVAEVTVVQGTEPQLVEAAQAAARGLRFRPATLGGAPVAVRLPFVYRFRAPPPAPVLGVLTGTVRAKGTRRPLADATLLLDGAPTPAATTDAHGRFTLQAPPGPHTLEVRAPGHKPLSIQEKLSAQQALDVVYRLEPTRLNPYETVVRDERPRTEVSRITLHEQELREVPGTQGDPFRVVMLMPGVGSLASGVSYPVVRGSQPAATGFFLDGVRIPILYHLLLGPAVVHPEFIDSIDFFPGTPPVQYGRLLGGAVEGHLTRPREDRFHASAYADFINAGAFVEYPFTSTDTHVSLAGRVSYTGLAIAILSNVMADDGASSLRVSFWDYQARVEQKVGQGRLRLFALGSSDDVGQNTPETLSRFGPEQGGGVRTSFHRVDLRGTHPLAGGEGELGLTLGVDDLGTKLEEGPPRVTLGEYALRQASVTARARWSRELGENVRLTVGGDVEHRRAAIILTGRAIPPGTSEALLADPFDRPSALAVFSGAYAEAQWRPSERWLFVPGVRVDGYHLVPGIQHWAVEPRLTVRHTFSETLTLRGGAGLFHQPPTVLMHLPVLDTTGLRYGLQEGLQFDLGAEWRPTATGFLQGLELSADAFYNPLRRTVEFDLQEALENRRRGSAALADPGESGYAYGLELMARHPLSRDWFGWISYSFLQSKRRARIQRFDDRNQVAQTLQATVPFAFEQAHVANAALSYTFGNNYTVGAVLHFNTGRPESGELTTPAQRIVTDEEGRSRWVRMDEDRVGRLGAFWRVDLRASKRWAKDDYTLELYLDVLNASLQKEVFAYEYTYERDTGAPLREPIGIPLVLPMLGLKGTY
jgi:TonB family protein